VTVRYGENVRDGDFRGQANVSGREDKCPVHLVATLKMATAGPAVDNVTHGAIQPAGYLSSP